MLGDVIPDPYMHDYAAHFISDGRLTISRWYNPGLGWLMHRDLSIVRSYYFATIGL